MEAVFMNHTLVYSSTKSINLSIQNLKKTITDHSVNLLFFPYQNG